MNGAFQHGARVRTRWPIKGFTSKCRFTSSESGSESGKDQRKNNKHQRKCSLSLGVNGS